MNHYESHLFITQNEYLPYFIEQFKMECLQASLLNVAGSDTNLEHIADVTGLHP